MGYRDRDWEWGWAGETTPASALLAEHLSVPSKEFECRGEAWTGEKRQGQVWFLSSACCVRCEALAI